MKAKFLWLLYIVCLLPACAKDKHKKQKPLSFLAGKVDTSFDLLSPDDIIREQHHSSEEQAAVTTVTDPEYIHQYEAKLADIPIPLHAKPLSLSYIDDERIMRNLTLEYRIRMSSHDLLTFYEHEMERLGWHRVNFFGNTYYVCTFKKPNRSCALFIEPLNKNKTARLVVCLRD